MFAFVSRVELDRTGGESSLAFAAKDSDASFGVTGAGDGADSVEGKFAFDACCCCSAEEGNNMGKNTLLLFMGFCCLSW